MIFTCEIDTPLGKMTAAAEDEALTGLWFNGQKYYPDKTDAWVGKAEHTVFAALRDWLADYFAGSNTPPAFPLAPRGTLFRQAVWGILLAIPYGETMTYGAIAASVAARRGLPSMSAQAVGGAVGHNPISILIPCHRVVGTDGSLTGYAGGIERKEALLRLEAGTISLK